MPDKNDINAAQRSFNNSWLLFDCDDIPSGLVVDLAVTTPIDAKVYVGRIYADGTTIELTLNQGGGTVAVVSTTTSGEVVKFSDCAEGVWGAIVFGYIPNSIDYVYTEECAVQINPSLVTYYNKSYIQAQSAGHRLLIEQGDSLVSREITANVPITLGIGLSGELVGSNLVVSVIDPTPYNSEAVAETIASEQNITTINGVSPVSGAVSIEILYNDEPIRVRAVADVVILESPELNPCDDIDIIDDYIGPNVPHNGETWILDNIYEKVEGSVTRNTEKLLDTQDYGYSLSLSLLDVDPVYDTLSEDAVITEWIGGSTDVDV